MKRELVAISRCPEAIFAQCTLCRSPIFDRFNFSLCKIDTPKHETDIALSCSAYAQKLRSHNKFCF